jgi:S13-like H2TH domain
MARPDTEERSLAESTAPERSLVQRMEALQRANEIRSRRAQLKRDLQTGNTDLATLLRSPPDYVETAKVFDLLLSVPKYGRVRVNKILSEVRISPSKTVGGLSERQREELISAIRPAGERSVQPRRADSMGVHRFADEIRRLVAEPELDASAVERAARTAASESVWDDAIGRLLTRQELLAVLDIPTDQLGALIDGGDVITLTNRSGDTRFPEFQFVDGIPVGTLTKAHRLLVHDGHVSPWSAAAWLMVPHPDLDGLSPAQWASEHRDDERLLSIAQRDAAHLAH